MIHLFLDESGECSFSVKTAYDYFLITILSIDETDLRKLKNTSKRIGAKLINRGWSKGVEIKAVNLYQNKRFGEKSIIEYLNALTVIDSLQVSYLAVNKSKITNESFRSTPYGIGYNYFTGWLLSELIFSHGMHNIHLTYDERNKESHPNQIFQKYLQTLICGKALEKDIVIDAKFVGANSEVVYGLRAVDFFCWSVYREITTGDNRFYKIFSNKLLYVNNAYI